jgi:hypothetical protein
MKQGGEMKSPTGKWVVTMKRDGKLNKATVNAESEWNAMFVAETLHGHRGWVSSHAVPAVLIPPQPPAPGRRPARKGQQ